jgi:hypothetical protein
MLDYMKNNNYLYTMLALFIFILAGCEKDNRTPPQSSLKGRVVYNKEPIGVRSGGVSFEIWQHDYQLFRKIALNIAQDGSFAALLFDGDYKLVRAKGAGPWADNSDSIDVHVSGAASIDIPVDPYFIIRSETFVKSGSTITATFTVQKVNTSNTLEAVRIYIGPNYILDQNNNSANVQKAAPIDLSGTVTLSVAIPASLAAENYIYARVGVKTTGINELMYSASQKVQLK